jgi:S1-C subfamily serine protease
MQAVRLPEALVAKLKLPNEVGLLVVSTEPGGPADNAGVLIGDVLVAVGKAPVSDPAELLAFLSGDQIGKTLQTLMLRAGEPRDVSITVGERPAQSSQQSRGPRRGR